MLFNNERIRMTVTRRSAGIYNERLHRRRIRIEHASLFQPTDAQVRRERYAVPTIRFRTALLRPARTAENPGKYAHLPRSFPTRSFEGSGAIRDSRGLEVATASRARTSCA